jgi:hypothetical protein
MSHPAASSGHCGSMPIAAGTTIACLDFSRMHDNIGEQLEFGSVLTLLELHNRAIVSFPSSH